MNYPDKALLVIDTMDIEPGATLTAYYDVQEIDVETVGELYKILEKKFPQNEIVVLPNSISLQLFDIKTLIFLREQINELLGDMANYE